ncbi:MarR family transcriptional regulator [Putridiphycobacter roseus]|uniref:MarR family transcriptional regulator n=1 Tax=Putridiphycobacter roseus TaxID=2219161 RepID=A0A2W1N0T2_9FLAO|nr:MarR family winged helix-turn-helix transcriptional regulator [Putridiphycobacter roseus]PZE18199.1 MarR family transcriptional regulator [Putridiphycobacter roseus]
MNKEELFEFHIRNNWFKISRYYNQLASKFNMSFSWGFILLNIEKKGTPSTSLGPKMGMESTSLSRTLKKMEEDGIIIRKNDDNDKRKSLVFLTSKGLSMRTEAREVVLDFNQKLYSKIPPEEVRTFFDTMMKVDNVITQLLEN